MAPTARSGSSSSSSRARASSPSPGSAGSSSSSSSRAQDGPVPPPLSADEREAADAFIQKLVGSSPSSASPVSPVGAPYLRAMGTHQDDLRLALVRPILPARDLLAAVQQHLRSGAPVAVTQLPPVRSFVGISLDVLDRRYRKWLRSKGPSDSHSTGGSTCVALVSEFISEEFFKPPPGGTRVLGLLTIVIMVMAGAITVPLLVLSFSSLIMSGMGVLLAVVGGALVTGLVLPGVGLIGTLLGLSLIWWYVNIITHCLGMVYAAHRAVARSVASVILAPFQLVVAAARRLRRPNAAAQRARQAAQQQAIHQIRDVLIKAQKGGGPAAGTES